MSENNNEFRYLYRGHQIGALRIEDMQLIRSVEQKNDNGNKALLMLHGFTSSPAVFRELIPLLESYDAIYCPVLPGHTGVFEDFEQVYAMDWKNHAETVCESLCREYSQVDVLGFSLGGLLACHLSQRFPVNHLYLLAPATDIHVPLYLSLDSMIRCMKVLDFLHFRAVRSYAGNLMNPEYPEIAFRKVPIHAVIEVLTLIQSFHHISPNCPVDLFLGSKDEVVDSEKVASRFQACNDIQIHWMNNSSHVLPLDSDRIEIANQINLKKLQKPVDKE